MQESSIATEPADRHSIADDLAIVILNYNTAALLRDCLRSVVASEHTLRISVAVVDNASQDGSADMVRAEFPDVRLIANATNVGYSAGNNVALRALGFDRFPSEQAECLPRYVLLLNPDTLLPATALAAMVRFMDEHPRIGAAGPRVRRLDGLALQPARSRRRMADLVLCEPGLPSQRRCLRASSFVTSPSVRPFERSNTIRW